MILLGKGAALKHLDRHRVYIYDLHDDPEGEVIKGGRGGRRKGKRGMRKKGGLKGKEMWGRESEGKGEDLKRRMA